VAEYLQGIYSYRAAARKPLARSTSLRVLKFSWFDKIAMECSSDSRTLFEGFSFLPRSGLHIPEIKMPEYVLCYLFDLPYLRPFFTILARKVLLSKFLYSSAVNGKASIRLL